MNLLIYSSKKWRGGATHHVEVAVLAGEVERRLAVVGGLVGVGARAQQQAHRVDVALPRRVVDRPHTCNHTTPD